MTWLARKTVRELSTARATLLVAGLLCVVSASAAAAQDSPARVVELSFTPTALAQLAIWVEAEDGTFLSTLRLTQATALRGIANRPGAGDMNSAFHWPYGRREGALPVWAHRRAAAPGAELFPRVVFQARPEGFASRTEPDSSNDSYYCLALDREQTRQDSLDAVSCASVFRSDKGRFLTPAEVLTGYAEPTEARGVAAMRPLSIGSLYPPRRDISPCTASPTCLEHPDARRFDDEARRVMPNIDAVTAATPPGDVLQRLLFTAPEDWPDGRYTAFLEVSVEGDYNDSFNADLDPTPTRPIEAWDHFAKVYGYPFRGQPSVVYAVPFELGVVGVTRADAALGFGDGSGQSGALTALDGRITDEPASSPGSGVDRLRLMADGSRLVAKVLDSEGCGVPPEAAEAFEAVPHEDEGVSHRVVRLRFSVPLSTKSIARYDVRVSVNPITDEETFTRGMPGFAATLETTELQVPVDEAPGAIVEVEMGGLSPEFHYYVALRAVDECNEPGPFTVAEVTTTKINFTTVTPCFIATAAYGTELSPRVGALRRLRDRHLLTHRPGRALVAAYYAVGPHVAAVIRDRPLLRWVVRAALEPLVRVAEWLD